MFGGYKSSLAPDRFNRPLSALSLNTGYYKLPAGNYFPNGEFTVAAWVKLRAYNWWSRLLDFGPSDSNGVFFALSRDTGNMAFGFRWASFISTNQPLPLNNWSHLSFVQQSDTITIYVNATIWTNGSLNAPQSIVRTPNFLGRSLRYSIKI